MLFLTKADKKRCYIIKGKGTRPKNEFFMSFPEILGGGEAGRTGISRALFHFSSNNATVPDFIFQDKIFPVYRFILQNLKIALVMLRQAQQAWFDESTNLRSLSLSKGTNPRSLSLLINARRLLNHSKQTNN
ncbi:hypothetical protein [Fibrobacter intestinalis]|uniref:hypothetical protein n=1 Tax=Fibrobacter intestinalis TaxID=28122 RepID=UPI0009347D8B|nr:hypothetical protein [Fibrobacter intestinalis]MDD7298800.1 hypothetical protein [Fibrobacter intestinalis]